MQIVIIGAGYAGLRTALELDKRSRGRAQRPRVLLVDQHDYHQDVPLLHLTATAAIPEPAAMFPLDDILRRRQVEHLQGRVVRIDAERQQVLLEGGQVLQYDRLVVTLGSQQSYASIPGAQEHTLPLRTYAHALHIRDHVLARFREAAETTDAEARRVLLTFVIVGGGFTGCQVAGELAAWVHRLARQHGVPRSEVRIALVQRSNLLLQQSGGWASTEAERVLDRRGVSVYLKTAAERVEPSALFVTGERMLRAATIIWSTGFQAPPLLADSGLPTDTMGRVKVDRSLRVEGYPQIYAGGDCANVPDPDGGSLPPMASFAFLEGLHLARALMDDIRGISPRTYKPIKFGPFISLGPGDAVGFLLGVPISGTPAAMIKQTIEQSYKSTLFL